jgi:release factor glutamine methyltransferase
MSDRTDSAQAVESAALDLARKRLVEAGVWDVDGDLAALVDRFLVRADQRAAAAEFDAAVAERCARIPLGHITGTAHFDGLVFAVGSGAFVPRKESTELVAWAAKQLPSDGRALDLCSGVGALGIALARRRPDASVACVEKDGTALVYLRRNAERHRGSSVPVQVLPMDLLDPQLLEPAGRARAGLTGQVDLVMANPPYVPPHVRLLPEWSKHQPRDAIYAGSDGMTLIRAIAALATRVLCRDGWLAFEHHHNQSEVVQAVIADAGKFAEAETFADSAGEPRITLARMTKQTEEPDMQQETHVGRNVAVKHSIHVKHRADVKDGVDDEPTQ